MRYADVRTATVMGGSHSRLTQQQLVLGHACAHERLVLSKCDHYVCGQRQVCERLADHGSLAAFSRQLRKRCCCC